jgi:hypothetical protein
VLKRVAAITRLSLPIGALVAALLGWGALV